MTFTEMKCKYPRHPYRFWLSMNHKRSENVHDFVMWNTGRGIQEQIWDKIFFPIRIRYKDEL